MEPANALSLIVPLPRPARGSATRLRLGSAELVLEASRGGYSLLWSDGREARRYVLGLTDLGQLSVELRAPRLPVHLVPREAVTIVPGGRVHGYVTVPLIPTLVWRDHTGQPQILIELHPPGLQGSWQASAGHVFRCASSWMVRFPYQTGEPRVIAPLRLYNVGTQPICPGHLSLHLRDDDLVPLRGAILVRPQRLTFRDDCTVETPTEHLSMEEA